MAEIDLGRVVGPQGIQGEMGIPGKNGFSPTITENSENDENTYKLDITTKDGKFTTPNLKGGNGEASTNTQEIKEMLGGLKFARDVDGNWGYVVPGTASVVPFGNGGSAFSVNEWYVTSGEDLLEKSSDNRWNVGNANGQTSVSWAIKVTVPVSASIVIYKPTSRNFDVSLNGEEIFSKGNNDFAMNYLIPVNLAVGVNNLHLIGGGTVSGLTISLPPVAQ